MNNKRAQVGLTLIEVMVGITLSLILLIAMTTILIKNRDTYRSQMTLQRYQEDVRMSSIMMGNTIRNAGAYGVTLYYDGTNFVNGAGTTLSVDQVSDIAGEMIAKEGVMFNGDHIIDSPVGNDGTSASLPHSLTVRFKSLGELLDCQGYTVGSSTNACVAANTFAIAANKLTCSVAITCDSGAPITRAAQPLVENVESMAIRYGVDTNLDGSVDQYVWPSQVGAANWGTVVSVQVALSAFTARDVNPVARTHTYFADIGIEGGAGVTTPAPGDKKARREYNTIIPINRRLHDDG